MCCEYEYKDTKNESNSQLHSLLYLSLSCCEYEYKDTKNESNSQPTRARSIVSRSCEYEYKDTKNESNSQLGLLLDSVGEVAGIAETGDDVGVFVDYLVNRAYPDSGLVGREGGLDIIHSLARSYD